MNILILGSGGREHAFAYNFLQSTRCEKLFVAPGNAGTKEIAINLDLKLNDFGSSSAIVHTSGSKFSSSKIIVHAIFFFFKEYLKRH